jgi:hypothetical protein
VHLVLIDLIPALLTWEGRGAPGPPEARPGVHGMIDDLYDDFRLAGLTDGTRPASRIREALNRLDLGVYFDNVGTSAVFGPEVTPRVVRRVSAALGASDRTILVTARAGLAETLRRAGIPVVMADGPLDELPAAIRRMASGRVNP